jgi:hypothetical protein
LPTVIDSFIVELGLDPSKLDKGQKEAVKNFKKNNEEFVKQGKQMEAQSKSMGDALESFGRKTLGVFALFAGGRGVKELAQYITAVDVAAGRLSKNINVGVGQLSAWYGVNIRAGGSAEGAAQSFANFNNQLQNFKATGEAGFIPFLRALEQGTGRQIQLNKPLEETYLDIADAVHKLAQTDRAYAVWVAKQIVGDDVLATTMADRGRGIKSLIEDQKKLGEITDEDIKASNQLNAAWADSERAAISLGRSILTWMTPALVGVLHVARDFFKGAANGDFVENSIRTSGASIGMSPEEIESEIAKYRASRAAKKASSNAPVTGTAFGNSGEKEAFIRATAAKFGINPNTAMQVAKSEGFNSFVGDRGTSFGAFQLHYGGRAGGSLAARGLGDAFTKDTGLDASDPKNERAAIEYALRYASKHGWGEWYGARRVGVGRFEGIGPSLASGGGGGTHNTDVRIDTINIQTSATDASGIAKDIQPELKRATMAANANYGQQ